MGLPALHNWLFLLVLFVVFWWFYFISRLRRKLFLMNLVMAVWVTCLYWEWIVYPLRGESWFYKIMLIISVLGALAHHLSIVYGRGGPRTKRVHGHISHLMYVIPVIIVGSLVSVSLWGNGSFWVHTPLIIIMGLGGFWAAFDDQMYHHWAKRFGRFARLAVECSGWAR